MVARKEIKKRVEDYERRARVNEERAVYLGKGTRAPPQEKIDELIKKSTSYRLKAGNYWYSLGNFPKAEKNYNMADKYLQMYKKGSKELREKIEGKLNSVKKNKGLLSKIFETKFVAFLSMIVFGVALVSISLKMTGFAIGNSENISAFVSVGFFVIGLVLAFIYLKHKEK